MNGTVAGLLVALGIGLLIGLERERRKADPGFGGAGGLRTHAVVAMAGALAMQFPGLIIVGIGALFVRRKPRVRLQALIHGGGQERGMRWVVNHATTATTARHDSEGTGLALAAAAVAAQ